MNCKNGNTREDPFETKKVFIINISNSHTFDTYRNVHGTLYCKDTPLI